MKKSIAIIGAGPAGYTAGLYAARGGHDVSIYMGVQPGGQLTTTTEIENFPGAWNTEKKEGLLGPVLMTTMQDQAEHFGSKLVYESVVDISWTDASIFTIITEESTANFDAVIIATGASSRYLGIEGEADWIGKGYHTCATCDGFFYRGKELIVVGGGDSAMEEANYLTQFATKVYLIHRNDNFKASNVMLERVKNNQKIEIITFASVKEFVIKDGKFAGAKVENLKNNSITELLVDGLFVAIGHIPNSKFANGKLMMDEAGYLLTRQTLFNANRTDEQNTDYLKYKMMSEIPGLFLAGDIQDKTYRQAITAAGDGCRAAIEVQRWLEDKYE
jgi:thioredoxin reductase (NADPH)